MKQFTFTVLFSIVAMCHAESVGEVQVNDSITILVNWSQTTESTLVALTPKSGKRASSTVLETSSATNSPITDFWLLSKDGDVIRPIGKPMFTGMGNLLSKPRTVLYQYPLSAFKNAEAVALAAAGNHYIITIKRTLNK